MVFTISPGGFVADQMWYNLECSISVIEPTYNIIIFILLLGLMKFC